MSAAACSDADSELGVPELPPLQDAPEAPEAAEAAAPPGPVAASRRPDARMVYRRALDVAKKSFDRHNISGKLARIDALIEREKELLR